MRFAGKTAIVTGGATGIGLATTRRLAQEGANVVFVGRREELGYEVESQLQAEGLSVKFLKGDVAVESDVKEFIAQTVDTFGKLDILINNAAISASSKFLDEDTAKWRKVFDVIVDGTYNCSRLAAKYMIGNGVKGHIINVSSVNAFRALMNSSHYNAAKGAMDQLTRCMALELADHGISVNGVAPGFIDTPMSFVDGENELETEWFKDIYVEQQKIVLRRAGLPEEIASVIAFLVSEDASYICGITIPVDGGLSITF
jgi:NAD(P)-dependent dehydrogenase (short-subunit alcohol dehydrogenase family)